MLRVTSESYQLAALRIINAERDARGLPETFASSRADSLCHGVKQHPSSPPFHRPAPFTDSPLQEADGGAHVGPCTHPVLGLRDLPRENLFIHCELGCCVAAANRFGEELTAWPKWSLCKRQMELHTGCTGQGDNGQSMPFRRNVLVQRLS